MNQEQEPLPIIDHHLCTGCHACVDLCPTGALAQIDGKAQLVHPQACTYCTACEEICLEGAIALPFIIVLGPPKEESESQ
jgi:NAD-dependent dihydropyrimidine dehydrogenase PreA subunit